jgi:hypothetical protein
MRRNGTLKQYAGDARRTRTAAVKRARVEQAFQATVLGAYNVAVSQQRKRWAVSDARRANRSLVQYLKYIRAKTPVGKSRLNIAKGLGL